MGNCVRTIEVWNRLSSSNNTEEEWITEFWALALQLERELQIANDRMLNNPWCEACKEPDCCVSGDGTCAMIRKYLNEHRGSECVICGGCDSSRNAHVDLPPRIGPNSKQDASGG